MDVWSSSLRGTSGIQPGGPCRAAREQARRRADATMQAIDVLRDDRANFSRALERYDGVVKRVRPRVL